MSNKMKKLNWIETFRNKLFFVHLGHQTTHHCMLFYAILIQLYVVFFCPFLTQNTVPVHFTPVQILSLRGNFLRLGI